MALFFTASGDGAIYLYVFLFRTLDLCCAWHEFVGEYKTASTLSAPPPLRTQILQWQKMKITEGIINLGHFWSQTLVPVSLNPPPPLPSVFQMYPWYTEYKRPFQVMSDISGVNRPVHHVWNGARPPTHSLRGKTSGCHLQTRTSTARPYTRCLQVATPAKPTTGADAAPSSTTSTPITPGSKSTSIAFLMRCSRDCGSFALLSHLLACPMAPTSTPAHHTCPYYQDQDLPLPHLCTAHVEQDPAGSFWPMALPPLGHRHDQGPVCSFWSNCACWSSTRFNPMLSVH